MMILFILIAAVAFLFWNIRRVSPGTRGSVIAGILIVATFGCFFFRGSFVASAAQAYLFVWLCQALWLFILWDLFLLGRKIYRRVRKIEKKGNKKFGIIGARVVLIFSLLLTAVFLAIGIPHNANYQIRELTIPAKGEAFTAVYFTDLHLDPLFKREKLERFIADVDSIQPDVILFGGDLADISDAEMTTAGYDTLFKELVSKAKVATFAVSGNHEAYTERSGSDPEGWLRKTGTVVLNDETLCSSFACITGRVDFQVAKSRDVPRKTLDEILPADSSVLWILMDHQPKGIEPEYKGRLPDLALSGHTHDGQFFPGTVVIDFVWRLAYGYGKLDGVPWLVTSGLDSWGPPVRVSSNTEFWVIKVK